MNWSPSQEKPDCLAVTLTPPEANAVANAVADYCMDRLQHGNEPFDFHMRLIEAAQEGRSLNLRYDPLNLRRLTKMMLEYASSNIQAAASETSANCPPDRLPFNDLAQDRLTEADTLTYVSEEIKAAVLTFEGRPNDVEMSEFVQESTR